MRHLKLVTNTERFAGLPRAIGVIFLENKLYTGCTLIEWTKHLKIEKIEGETMDLHTWYRNVRQQRYTTEEQELITGRVEYFNQIFWNKYKTKEAHAKAQRDHQPNRQKIIGTSLLEMHDEELQQRPTPFSTQCSKWHRVAYDSLNLEFKPPCVMCRCAYPIDYPPSALPPLGNDINCREIHQEGYRGKCVEGLLSAQVL